MDDATKLVWIMDVVARAETILRTPSLEDWVKAQEAEKVKRAEKQKLIAAPKIEEVPLQ